MSQDVLSKEELLDRTIEVDPQLSAAERETSLTFPKDRDEGLFHSEVPTTIKWVLSIEESTITDTRFVDGSIVAVTATVPKGVVKLQATARKSNTHSQMVSYGPLRD